MTEGRYQRVWTPLSDDVLLVDDAAGKPLPVELLSHGVREQLFLSLRLALAGSYARRGAQLPMILDDVLVNFDAKRVRATAGVLCELAATGYQLLVFTCHEHIARLFEEMDAEVKELPDHAESRPVASPRRADRKPRKRKIPAAGGTNVCPPYAVVAAAEHAETEPAAPNGEVAREPPAPPLEELAPWEEDDGEAAESEFADEEEPAEERDVEEPLAEDGSGGAEAA